MSTSRKPPPQRQKPDYPETVWYKLKEIVGRPLPVRFCRRKDDGKYGPKWLIVWNEGVHEGGTSISANNEGRDEFLQWVQDTLEQEGDKATVSIVITEIETKTGGTFYGIDEYTESHEAIAKESAKLREASEPREQGSERPLIDGFEAERDEIRRLKDELAAARAEKAQRGTYSDDTPF